jgi:hypothetical protein
VAQDLAEGSALAFHVNDRGGAGGSIWLSLLEAFAKAALAGCGSSHSKAAVRADARKHVLLVNADREFRERKPQNFLRPEDINKIVHVNCERGDAPA